MTIVGLIYERKDTPLMFMLLYFLSGNSNYINSLFVLKERLYSFIITAIHRHPTAWILMSNILLSQVHSHLV